MRRSRTNDGAIAIGASTLSEQKSASGDVRSERSIVGLSATRNEGLVEGSKGQKRGRRTQFARSLLLEHNCDC